jgi:hypothetical protein
MLRCGTQVGPYLAGLPNIRRLVRRHKHIAKLQGLGSDHALQVADQAQHFGGILFPRHSPKQAINPFVRGHSTFL